MQTCRCQGHRCDGRRIPDPTRNIVRTAAEQKISRDVFCDLHIASVSDGDLAFQLGQSRPCESVTWTINAVSTGEVESAKGTLPVTRLLRVSDARLVPRSQCTPNHSHFRPRGFIPFQFDTNSIHKVSSAFGAIRNSNWRPFGIYRLLAGLFKASIDGS